MKNIFILFFITFSSLVSGKTYYVSTSGNNNNTGTINSPWATWNKAFTSNVVQAGDTVIFRGGVYQIAVTDGMGVEASRNGTSNNWIVYMNYPGEVPILDCGNVRAQDITYTGLRNYGLRFSGISYVKVIGLTVRNVKQYYDRNFGVGYEVYNSTVTLERCTAYNVWGHGFELWAGGSGAGAIKLINCDSYNNCDSISGGGSNAGNTGAGFSCWDSGGNGLGSVYLYGCRAWGVSDQGFQTGGSYYIKSENCWSFCNDAYVKGGGTGWKQGWQDYSTSFLLQETINCLAAFNDGIGFMTNTYYGVDVPTTNTFNNTAIGNSMGFAIDYLESGHTADETSRIYRNNIAYNNSTDLFLRFGDARYSHSNNSWDGGASITSADFKNLPAGKDAARAILSAPRKADGSLPDIGNYFQLNEGSDAIDAGLNTGLPFNGKAPDLGAFESSYGSQVIKPVTSITVNGAGGSSIISTNKGTLQLYASVLPSDASNKSVTWSIVNGTGQATISTTGVVTAVANGTVTARATASDGSGVTGQLVITISGQNIPVTGITVTGTGGSSVITNDKGQLQLIATVVPSDATNKSVTWTIVNGTGQATINSNGLVTAVVSGTVTARATSNDGSGVQGNLLITITNQFVPVTSISVNGSGGASAISQNKGILALIATVSPGSATNKTVTWSIVNGTGQATISTTGVVTAVANGTVTARATANDGSGVTGQLVVTISGQTISVTSITVTASGNASTITSQGGSLQLYATVEPSNASNKSVTWSIADGTGLASISTSGLVTASANGIFTAKATANDGSGVYGTYRITISNQNPDTNLPPVVDISSPTKNTTYVAPATIYIDANAFDPDGTISKVEFYSGSQKLGEKISSPYSFTWKEVPEGTYSITAIASDNKGSRTTSEAITAIVQKSSQTVNQLPIVSITVRGKHNNDTHFKKKDKIEFEVNAADSDGSISSVVLKNGDNIITEMTAEPYIYVWEAIDTGTFSFTAIATDNMGGNRSSSELELIIEGLNNSASGILNLYPNPNDGHFTVDLLPSLSDQEKSIAVINQAGVIVYKENLGAGINSKQFNLTDMFPGAYIIALTDEKNIITTKRMIKR